MQIDLPTGKKIYFASDFHLGAYPLEQSLERERKIVRWLSAIQPDAEAIFLVGDLFDFWFEYRYVVPKGYVRFLGKLAELADSGIKIVVFTGNHDLWMRDYLVKELGVRVEHQPLSLRIGSGTEQRSLYVGHGDGLGPGDRLYKILKRWVFLNPICVWAFGHVLPTRWGMALAHAWSKSSRISNQRKGEEKFLSKEREWLYVYSTGIEQHTHHDYYVFGHRHLVLNLALSPQSQYLNLGEWVTGHCHYGVYEGQTLRLERFE